MKLKKLLVVLLGGGLVTMALDAGIAHFGGGVIKHPGQVVPVAFGVLALLLAGPILALDETWFRRVARAVAGVAIGVGALGTLFHGASLMSMLTASGSLELSGLALALTIAPPVLAPGAFIGLGALVWFVASPRVEMTMTTPRLSAIGRSA